LPPQTNNNKPPEKTKNNETAATATAEAPSGLLPWQAAMADIKKRSDLKTIMIIGAGPIVIGQACEFDYSGTQACKALRQEGYRVVLLNSNPATIMTDPGMADRTYVGPMTPELVEQILEAEKPDAILPTMGGQTGLNLAKALAESGILDKYGVELIGAKLPSIDRAEDRELFKQAMTRIGLKTPPSGTASSVEEALAIAAEIGRFPLIIRPAFTLGGTGGGISYNLEEFKAQVQVSWSCCWGCFEGGKEGAANNDPWFFLLLCRRRSPAPAPRKKKKKPNPNKNRPASTPRSPTRSSSSSPSSAGRSTSSRSCATWRTTSSSSAPSRTSIPWACTRATASRWPRPRR
jgi:hypothetical protein